MHNFKTFPKNKSFTSTKKLKKHFLITVHLFNVRKTKQKTHSWQIKQNEHAWRIKTQVRQKIQAYIYFFFQINQQCLYPTPTNHLPIFSDIHPAELCQLGATLSSAYHGSLDPDHMQHGLLSGSFDAYREILKSRYPFVPTAWNLLNNLAGLGIHISQWTNYKWNTEYCESTSRLCAFIPIMSARPAGLSLPQTAWVKLNHLWIGVGQFHLFMHK